MPVVDYTMELGPNLGTAPAVEGTPMGNAGAAMGPKHAAEPDGDYITRSCAAYPAGLNKALGEHPLQEEGKEESIC